MFRCVLSLLVLLASAEAWSQEPKPPQPEFKKPALIRVEGPIDAWLEHFVLRKLERAKHEQCDLVIFEIDSPGGGVQETLNMCDEITSLKGVHTVAYIPREALSGAAILALSCDDIVMGEFAQIGDCAPIYLAEDFLFRHAPDKIRSHLVSKVRELCGKRKHPGALAEAMVDGTVRVERLRAPDGTVQLLTDREVSGRPEVAQWEKIETLPESGGGRLLEVLGSRAKDLGLAAATVDRREQLYERYGFNEPPLILESGVVDTTAYILNMWVVTGLLILIGLVGLAHEFFAPGTMIGALIAGLCFALFFWARFLGGTSGWLEVVLFASGLVFLAMEVFVIPGFGVTGIIGLGLMGSGIMLALQSFTLPTTNAELATTATALVTTTVSGLAGLVTCGVMLRQMHNIPLLNRLMLQPPAPDAESAKVLPDGKPLPMAAPALDVGDWGTATTMLRPGGKAQFGDHIFDVVADGAFIQPGIQVRVTEVQATRIVVEAAS